VFGGVTAKGESRIGEFQPQHLAERSVNLSTHPAPCIQFVVTKIRVVAIAKPAQIGYVHDEKRFVDVFRSRLPDPLLEVSGRAKISPGVISSLAAE
jgi:hypothetical protein